MNAWIKVARYQLNDWYNFLVAPWFILALDFVINLLIFSDTPANGHGQPRYAGALAAIYIVLLVAGALSIARQLPLALAFGPNGDLLAANGDAVNGDPTQPSEIVEFTEAGDFVTQFNVDAAQGGAFGLAVGQTPAGFFSLVTVDDVANTIQVYPLLVP